MGYDCAVDGELLVDGFQRWLGARFGRPELAYWEHVLKVAFPSGDATSRTALSEDQDTVARCTLFDLLDEFLGERITSLTSA